MIMAINIMNLLYPTFSAPLKKVPRIIIIQKMMPL